MILDSLAMTKRGSSLGFWTHHASFSLQKNTTETTPYIKELIMILFLAILCTDSWAHKPSFGPNPSQENAFQVLDPNISIVVYQEITCEESQLWLEFSAEAGFELYVQGGIPEIARLEEYYPHIAVLYPGFPEPDRDYPFRIPDGMGVLLLEPDTSPSDFYEPFTQTSSWIWIEQTIALTQTGTGYIVGWNDDMDTGKLWLATGVVEDFSDVSVSDFIIWNEYVNDFHETGKFNPVYPKEEQNCMTNDTIEESKDGCAGGAAWLFLPLLLNRRRKTTGQWS